MKLELKHLAGYLPYELKVLNTITNRKCSLSESTISKVFNNAKNHLLILRQFSDYSEILEIVEEMNDYEIGMIEDNPDMVKRLGFEIIELMFKNHIDIYGLLNKGLATQY